MLYIKDIVCKETNDMNDPEMSNNGGGYHQPLYTFNIYEEDNKTGKVKIHKCEIHDTSCGDFGSRVYVEVCGLNAYFGTMLDKTNEHYTEFDENNNHHMEILDLVEEFLNYRIPTIQSPFDYFVG